MRSGDKARLELRIEGDHLTALLNGAVVIEARDQHLAGPGEWGIDGNGWFESAEVQPLGAAPRPCFRAFRLGQRLATAFHRARMARGNASQARVQRRPFARARRRRKAQPTLDGAIRAKLIYQDGTNGAGVTMRSAEAGLQHYSLALGGSGTDVFLVRRDGSGNVNLARVALPKPLKPGDSITLELRVQGDRISGLANGVLVGPVTDNQITSSGYWGTNASDAWFESVEVQPLALPYRAVAGRAARFGEAATH